MRSTAERIGLLAADLGRLRRHLRPEDRPGGDYLEFLLDRLALHVGALDAMARATAAELIRDGLDVDDALATVDADEASLRRALGGSITKRRGGKDLVPDRRERRAKARLP